MPTTDDIAHRLRKLDGTAAITSVLDRCLEAADEIERLRAALAAEREECAQVAETYSLSRMDAAAAIAAAIRARR